MYKIISFFIDTLFARFYVRFGIVFTRGKYLHDHIILLRGEVWVNENTNVVYPPPLFSEVPVLSSYYYRCVVFVHQSK
jgi:hypothetical protein